MADFNGDGVPDLAVTNNGSDTASVLLGGTVTTGQLNNIPSQVAANRLYKVSMPLTYSSTPGTLLTVSS